MSVSDHLDANLTEIETELRSLVKAARKIAATGGHYPTHLGACIGVLSSTECACGVADVLFALRRLDTALLAGTALKPCDCPPGSTCWAP